MANNLWSNYTEKTATPVDADEVMVLDSTDRKNKRLLFGTFWKWVAKKLNEATISELETDNKTIIGAINALNGKRFSAFDVSLDTAIASSLDSFKCGITKYATTVSDAPEEGNGFLISIYRSQNNICQIAIPENSGKIYSRISKNPDGVFCNWK